MSDNLSGYGPPRLKGYSIERVPLAAEAAVHPAAGLVPEIRFTLHGDGFIVRAMPLIIMIDGVWVRRYKIAPDRRSVICFLDEMPEEGAVISAGYGGEERVELPERFSRSHVLGGDAE